MRWHRTSLFIKWPDGGMKFPKADIRSPFEIAQMAKMVHTEDFPIEFSSLLIWTNTDTIFRAILTWGLIVFTYTMWAAINVNGLTPSLPMSCRG